MLSSEIQNSNYYFNGNEITSSFGQYNLSTEVNNKLRWINKLDKVNLINYEIYNSNFFFKKIPYLPTSTQTGLQQRNFLKLEKICNINLNPIQIDVLTTQNINLDNISTIDGVQLNNNYLVMVKNQVIDTENGIYKYFDNKLTRELKLDNEETYLSKHSINYIFLIKKGSLNKHKFMKIEKQVFENGAIVKYVFSEVDYYSNLKRFIPYLDVRKSRW